jgi:hypothetical protein
MFLTALVSADIEENLSKFTVLINRVELLNYKIFEIFSYLVKQLSNISVSERKNNRNSIIYICTFFIMINALLYFI